MISSPNYPNDYDNSVHCVWIIQVEEGQIVTFTFHDMDLESSLSEDELCDCDYVEVSDEINIDEYLQQAKIIQHNWPIFFCAETLCITFYIVFVCIIIVLPV